ncbi:uncharacterized protein F4812DRAFT_407787 [Daldinia caldariorum]|uniref:uncharacterized protein n=1 Tax=Daldinia caldariorum TaxID=326644 RepID=UPI002007E75B|nr:uncharacterized protein F4812DRAFT_407787 [Daldinia caldariorum]KAI1472203.1 hypothetical protein F4812DRAFT_407787 [Daldinia caldariorum]
MPFEENFEFDAARYREEVKGFAVARLQQQEIAMGRKYLAGGFATGFGLSSAVFTGGLSLLLAGYKGRSTYVASKKREIIQAELRRRNLKTRHITAKDAAISWSIGAMAALIGMEVGDFTEGMTNINDMGAALPDGANESTGLTADPGKAAEGMAGQVQQLAAHVAGDGAAGVATQVAAADTVAYHAGMVQAKIIEEHLANEATEATLVALTDPPEEPKPGCSHTKSRVQTESLGCDRCSEGIEKGHCYWHCCDCSGDNYDICIKCRTKGAACKNKNHSLRKLQVPT